jgi:aryl-alcohol dehydrogenase-like predicted oxidoreductase
MYGFGGAEGILGKLTPRNRERMIVTSKAGILPPKRSILHRLLSRGVGSLHKALPPSKRYVPRPEVWEPRFGFFKLPNLRRSIETSLRQLRTDYLDILLLHECTLADVEAPELLDFLQALKKQGIIREFGIATGIEETVQIAAAHPLLTPVIQIPNSIWRMNITHLPSRPKGLTITHSVLTSRVHVLLTQLSTDDSLAREWESATHVNPRDPTALAQLFLAHALRSNRGGVVLFFSSRPENIGANVKLVKESTVDASQVDGLISYLKNRSDRSETSESFK